MQKELMIDGRALALSANAATPVRYQMTFQSDLLNTLGKITTDSAEHLSVVSQMAYIMAKQAEGEVKRLSFENYLEWLEQFEDPMAFVNASADIISFYLQNVKTGSKAKNPKGPRSAK